MAAHSPASPCFTNLPYELRHRIWRAALPKKDDPAVFFYKKGCFGIEHIPEYHMAHVPEFHFYHERLNCVQVVAPIGLLFVNSEARGIALEWARDQGLQLRFHSDRQCHVFVRALKPDHDTLYFETDMFEDFESVLFDYYWLPDSQRRLTDDGQAVTSIAVPDALLSTGMESAVLSDALHWFRNVAVLYIIINPPSDLRGQDDDVAQRRWELTSRGGNSWFWNTDSRCFDLGGGNAVEDEELCRLRELVCEALIDYFVYREISNFEVRTVFAVGM